MEDKNDRMNRRGFLSGFIKVAALGAIGAAVLGGGCKCGDEDVDWSDEGDETPPPEGEGGGKKKPAPKSNAGS